MRRFVYILYRRQEATPILWQVKEELLPMNTRGTALIASSFRPGEKKGEAVLFLKASAFSYTALG